MRINGYTFLVLAILLFCYRDILEIIIRLLWVYLKWSTSAIIITMVAYCTIIVLNVYRLPIASDILISKLNYLTVIVFIFAIFEFLYNKKDSELQREYFNWLFDQNILAVFYRHSNLFWGVVKIIAVFVILPILAAHVILPAEVSVKDLWFLIAILFINGNLSVMIYILDKKRKRFCDKEESNFKTLIKNK